jgi:hypothetical protein
VAARPTSAASAGSAGSMNRDCAPAPIAAKVLNPTR